MFYLMTVSVFGFLLQAICLMIFMQGMNVLRKIFIIFNTKWPKKEILYDETILTYLSKMSSDKRKQLYDIINMVSQDIRRTPKRWR